MRNNRHNHTEGIHHGGNSHDDDSNHSNHTNPQNSLDAVLTNRFWGLLIFIAIIWLMFYCTFTLGSYPQHWIESLMGNLSGLVAGNLNTGWFSNFLQNGLINGVGAVLAFLPNILILFFFISLLEETQYLPRAARLMDKYMHGIGLHGSSFIPLLMGFGCNVPAIMATRSIERKNDRILTMMMIPYIPCSARIPTFLLFSGIFFPDDKVLVMMLLYLTGIIIGIIIAILNKKVFFREKSEDYAIFLPPLKAPKMAMALKGMWSAAEEYLKKIGTVVLLAVIIVWALDYFPIKQHNPEVPDKPSYLQQFGKAIEPVMAPLGFDWKMGAALITGVTAKEFIVSTLGVLYQEENDGENNASLAERIKGETYVSGPNAGQKVFNKQSALSFMVFALLYIPCVAAATTIRKESGSWKWAIISICTTLVVAWIAAFATYNIGFLIWR